MTKRTRTTAAQAAAMIRKNLRAQGLDVSVTSDTFSMGDSVDVRISDQSPAIRKLVDQYCRMFQYGHFDAMQDMYEYSNQRADVPQVKFVHVSNQMSGAMRNAIYQHLRTAWAGGDQLPETYAEGRTRMLFLQGEWVDQLIGRQFRDEDSTFWRSRKIQNRRIAA